MAGTNRSCAQRDRDRRICARGLTLFEVLIALTLLAALAAIALPLVVSQTRRVTFTETLSQIERQAAVVRGEAQRRSQAVWFEARWDPSAKTYRLGTRAQTEEGPAETSDEPAMSELLELAARQEEPSGDSVQDSEQDSADFEERLRLPKGYELRRTLPDELYRLAEAGTDRSSPASESSGRPRSEPDDGPGPADVFSPDALAAAFADDAAGGEESDPTQRVVLALFLPDGTLLGPERVFLVSQDHRVATVSMNPWLGEVRCEQLRVDDLVAPAEAVGAADQTADDAAKDEGGTP